jgi:hypothetical protein
VVIESTFAATSPPLISRLAELGVPYIVDPLSLRFADDQFLSTKRVADLPYAPGQPLPALGSRDSARRLLVSQTMEFADRFGSCAYLLPGVPLSNDDSSQPVNLAIVDDAVALNGNDVPSRPIVALVAPNRATVRDPYSLLAPLLDKGVDAVYIQPTRFRPLEAGPEDLLAYLALLAEARRLGFHVLAGRTGAFGLLALAIGVDAFDSGLGEAESFDLSALNKVRPEKPKEAGDSGGQAGRDRRVYLTPLLRSLSGRQTKAVASDDVVSARLLCKLPCCRFGTFEGMPDRRHNHVLHARAWEVEQVAGQPTATLRIERLRAMLGVASTTADIVQRCLLARDIQPARFAYINTWTTTLERIAAATAAA